MASTAIRNSALAGSLELVWPSVANEIAAPGHLRLLPRLAQDLLDLSRIVDDRQ